MSTPLRPSLALNRRDALLAASAPTASAGLQLGAARAAEPTRLDLPSGDPSSGYITTDDRVQIFYKDWGPRDAQPIFFHHGWPLSSDDWDAQMLFFLVQGYRVAAHDRRGHGRSPAGIVYMPVSAPLSSSTGRTVMELSSVRRAMSSASSSIETPP